MNPIRARLHGPLIATTALLVVGAGCSSNPGSSIENAGAAPLASPAGSRTDVLERDDRTMKARNMEDLLTNRIPGVLVRRTRNDSWIEIRGQGTINMSSEALIVIDGIQNSSRGLLTMNPEQVQRIQVLKGASAAIYGVRGANGVLVVTTRRQHE